jgi:hypothetical protein
MQRLALLFGRGLRAHIGQDIVIHTIQGPSVRGVLCGAGWDGVRLVSAKHLDEDEDMVGQVGVPWGNVWTWQLLPLGSGE